jgi:N-sulfoglucosamine sulfohydrolase
VRDRMRRMKPASSRRQFVASAVAGWPAAAMTAAERPQRRPNILFLFADDWMFPHASCLGDAVVKTPTFDRVVRTGVLFTNAFVASPSCSPSRAAVLTGQWHWRLEEGANLGGTLAAKFPVYPDLLGAAGYHAGYTGKPWAPGDIKPGGRTRNPAGRQFPDFAAFLAERPADAPFCFWFGSPDPHRPYAWEGGVKSGLKTADVRVPPYLPDSEIVRKDICDYYSRVQRYDRAAGEALKQVEAAGELDNTIVVMSGDNGWPFPRSKASLYESGTHAPLAISWPARVAGNRKVEDFVSLTDLAPTFLEAAGVPVPPAMTGRSLMPLLRSRLSGRIDIKRDHVLTGMERHVPCRGESKGGYPSRALRTREFHYIRNFKPDRWPAGDPGDLDKLTYEQLAQTTFVSFADIDAGPTKADMVMRRNDPAVAPLFRLATARRPERELYELKSDPYQMRNLATDPKYKAVADKMDAQLMAELKATGDPRASGGGEEFDRYIWYQGRSMRQ